MIKIFSLYLFLTILFVRCSSSLTYDETYYENGNIKTSGYSDSKGNLQSEFVKYYQTGEIASRATMVDNKFNGTYERYYKNGNIRSIMKVKNNILYGWATNYYSKGGIEKKVLFHNSIPMFISVFDKKGNVIQMNSGRKYGGNKKVPNSTVFFDKNRKVINDPEHYKTSYYAIVNYGKKNKTLKVRLFGFYNDSIIIKYKRDFRDGDKSVIREINTIDSQAKELLFDIEPTDYYKGKINVLIETYRKTRVYTINSTQINIPSSKKEMCIQLEKGEKPAKYNLNPIW